MFARQKIVANYSDIAKLAKKYHQENKAIVLTQGSFDMVHIGHGRYLEKAKKHGDVLFVGLDEDEKIRIRKGEGRPIVPEKERLEMLAFFASVDHVVLKPFKIHHTPKPKQITITASNKTFNILLCFD